ncbi:MAG: hypothetical protein FJW34_13750 [Acidobacteria bacterium]|nr:hypothetical protein [Acidobacteriota bacterium]
MRLLAALAKLDDREDWREAPLCCLPSRGGGWIARSLAVGLPPDWDSVPTEKPKIQAWLEPCLPPRERALDWALDRACQRHEGARKYIEGVSRAKLEDIMSAWWERLPEIPSDEQVDQVLEATSWVRAKMRQRPGLVTKVLCEAGSQLVLAPLGSAVLADPYASRARRRFFPGLAVVSDRYLKHDPQATEADWRSFFESPGIDLRGPLRLERRTRALDRLGLEQLAPGFKAPSTRKGAIVVEYWGQRFSSKRYLVADFLLPGELARVLEKGVDREAARDIGQWLREARISFPRQATRALAYVRYYESSVSPRSLPKPSSWVEALTERQWIFATDGSGPYRPSALLPEPDRARPGAPVADLRGDLVQTLVECGIPFGSEISDVPHLERLRLEGPRVEPMRLRELIQQAIAEAGEDAERQDRLREVLQTTALFPGRDAVSRVPIVRLVRRAPRGSDFGGWLIALDQLPAGDPLPGLVDLVGTIFEVPEVPTWDQACGFLEWVWRDKPDADAVRRVLPRGYEMIREGLAGQPGRQRRWDEARPRAAVFTRSRKWILVEGGQVFLDDLEEPRLESYLTDVELATPGHLGETAEEQRQTAELLGLRLLSSRYQVETRPEDEQPSPPEWEARFTRVCEFVERLALEEREDTARKPPLKLLRCGRLLKVLVGPGIQRTEWVVQAAFRGPDVLVAGDPIDFMAELCPLLLAWAGLSGRRDMERLAPQVTQLIGLLDRPEKSEQQVAELHRQKGWAAPSPPPGPPPPREPPGPPPEPVPAPPPRPHTPVEREALLDAARRRYGQARREYEQLLAAGPVPAEPGEDEPPEKAYAGPSDEPYREAVIQYERAAGRHPVAKPSAQPGHDIDSYSHPEGDAERKLVRRIEVKGKGRAWTDAETVELTNRQFGDMLKKECEQQGEEDFDYWLYVVEPGREGVHNIVPVRNPAQRTAKFELRGGTWRREAEAAANAP